MAKSKLKPKEDTLAQKEKAAKLKLQKIEEIFGPSPQIPDTQKPDIFLKKENYQSVARLLNYGQDIK